MKYVYLVLVADLDDGWESMPTTVWATEELARSHLDSFGFEMRESDREYVTETDWGNAFIEAKDFIGRPRGWAWKVLVQGEVKS